MRTVPAHDESDATTLQVGETLASDTRRFRVSEGDVEAVAAMRGYLVDAAKARASVTYGELVRETGLSVPPRGLGRLLVLLSEDCARRGEPTLAAIVVTQSTGEVGDGYGSGASQDRDDLYAYWRLPLLVSGVVLDAPDAAGLAAFYRALLVWEVAHEQEGWVQLRSPHGGAGLSFQSDPDYVRPVWPGQPGHQRMMVHLDIRVDGLQAEGERARALGAVLADHQPQDDIRVYLDPAGHPFCMWDPAELRP